MKKNMLTTPVRWKDIVEGIADSEDIWTGIKNDYVIPHAIRLNDVAHASFLALRRLKKAIRSPSRKKASLREVPPRNADCWKNESNPVFKSNKPRNNRTEYCRNVRCSLGPFGMIAVSGGGRIHLRQFLWHVAAGIEKYRGAF